MESGDVTQSSMRPPMMRVPIDPRDPNDYDNLPGI